MFDFHMHSDVSYDGRAAALRMALAAKKAGLKEICFTDHLDYDPLDKTNIMDFDTARYNAVYDPLEVDGLVIRRGCEFGLLEDNAQVLKKDLQRRHFDFVIGSVHFVDGLDLYFEPFWKNRTVDQAEQEYLESTLACVQHHEDFDVLGHLTYITKTWANPEKRPVVYDTYRQIVDEIFKELVRKDKGIEVNTSGMDVCGVFLPDREYLLRFKELGGKIVTVGSDAHDEKRVGQHCSRAAEMVNEIFGHVCTFADRKPVFHRL